MNEAVNMSLQSVSHKACPNTKQAITTRLLYLPREIHASCDAGRTHNEQIQDDLHERDGDCNIVLVHWA